MIQQPIINKIQNLIDYDKYIEEKEEPKINIIKKDTNGEVFTPISLANSIIENYIPKSIYKNPQLKWLEPCAGNGSFLIATYIKLFYYLENWEPDNVKRRKHIIENMLYMVEIDRSNYNKLRRIFGPNANIKCSDFLNVKYDVNFDVIIGNPPFQDNYGLTNKGKRILGGKTKLYEKIFIKSFSILKEGGYLTFITPDNIFSGITESYRLLVENHVKQIHFGLKEYFPTIQQDMCSFVVLKGATGSTTITSSNNSSELNIKLILRPVNPIKMWNKHTEILVKKYITNERNDAVYNRGKNIANYKGNKYQLIYTKDKFLQTNNKELAVGIDQKKAVIFFISHEANFKMDFDGKYGVGPNTFYILFDSINSGKRLEHFLSSNEYKELVESTRTTRQYIKIALIEYLNLNLIMKPNIKAKTRKHKTNLNKTKKHKK